MISVGDGSGGVLVLVLIQLPDREWTTGIVQPCAGDAGRKFAIVFHGLEEGPERVAKGGIRLPGQADGAAAQTGSGGDLAPEIPAFIGIVGDGADLVDDGGFTLDVRLVSDRAATVIALGNADVERGVSQAVSHLPCVHIGHAGAGVRAGRRLGEIDGPGSGFEMATGNRSAGGQVGAHHASGGGEGS